jgi:hypothetical protein
MHRQALIEVWNGLDTNNIYTSVPKINDDGTGEFFITPVKPDWVLPFSLQFGEMLYQLRGALDSVVYDAACLKFSQDPPPDEQKWSFPVCPDPDKFEEAMRRMKNMPNDVRGLIEAVQPYAGATGRHRDKGWAWDIGQSLAVLNDWARIDRHRRLHIVGTTPTEGNLRIGVPPGMTLEYCNFTVGVVLENDSKIAEFKIANYVPGADIHFQPKFTFDITVDEAPKSLLHDVSIATSLSVQIVRENFETHFGIQR